MFASSLHAYTHAALVGRWRWNSQYYRHTACAYIRINAVCVGVWVCVRPGQSSLWRGREKKIKGEKISPERINKKRKKKIQKPHERGGGVGVWEENVEYFYYWYYFNAWCSEVKIYGRLMGILCYYMRMRSYNVSITFTFFVRKILRKFMLYFFHTPSRRAMHINRF